MSTKSREREQARRREEKWDRHVAQLRAKRQRTWSIVGVVVALVVIGVAVWWALAATQEPGTDPGGDTGGAPSGEHTLPPASAAEGRDWTTTLTTSAGDLTLTLDGAAAPQAVASFVSLAESGYFDGTSCHRLTTSGIYVLQCGDPTGTGTGDPGYKFGPVENAPTDDVYPAGTVAMARQGGDAGSMGSQFFLVYEDSTIPSDAAGGYTVFGTITSGLDVVQAVADAGTQDGSGDGSPATPVTIEGVETQ
ncbi:peptidylprolyl isomerase [Cellulosimicrobium cellulans]|uniref:peptidylprolyl isomerase n=1 Tax=Cellulosimicrobium TaxID=157920 RepID=UPI0008830AEA|nr:peptidylprolyl isomerase [Sphaerisporangium cinnabarinum]MCR1981218.1 peptidylprolyl isomerase [Cellulosimicrobium cellulans]PTU58135.1 peptidylprolyl isomerase [Sphaerisporangium cinnabarinum]SDF48706.1 peptidyl-prolyl cis-trans isomerase B (cyclophilin B) [Cellulosimicrobium cellulans]